MLSRDVDSLAAAPQGASVDSPLLDVVAVTKHFSGRRGWFGPPRPMRAVDGVSFQILAGEIFGVVGESGSGKSTLGAMVAHLITPTSGVICICGEKWSELSLRDLGERRRNVQIVFQNPYASLDPRWTVEKIVAEPIVTYERLTRTEVRDRVSMLLTAVGLNGEQMDGYAHQFSGGQRQRIAIARALAGRPQLLVADEPVSALDVSVQAQVINLLADLHERQGMAILFISHNLAIVQYMCHRIGVLYLGQFVEIGRVDEIFAQPWHYYTRALLDAIPEPVPEPARLRLLSGEIPSSADPPSGCRFHPRCPRAEAYCETQAPPLREFGGGRMIACHFPIREL